MRKIAILIPILFFVLFSGCVNPGCGDDYCDKWTESSFSCPEDCGESPLLNGSDGDGGNGTIPPNPELCGNGVVNSGETCLNCPSDVKCGAGKACANGRCVELGSCGNDLVDTGETRFNCCQDVGCEKNEECTGGACKLKSCTGQGGEICASGKICNTEVVLSIDSTICCLSECVLKRCEQMNGYVCQEYEYCDKSYLAASDTDRCCPKYNCISTATCLTGDGCKSGCPQGDSDCKCADQGGYSAKGPGYCLENDVIKARDGTPCCKNPILNWTCYDDDEGKDILVNSQCNEIADLNIGSNYSQKFRDSCSGTTALVEYYCTAEPVTRCDFEVITCSNGCLAGVCE